MPPSSFLLFVFGEKYSSLSGFLSCSVCNLLPLSYFKKDNSFVLWLKAVFPYFRLFSLHIYSILLSGGGGFYGWDFSVGNSNDILKFVLSQWMFQGKKLAPVNGTITPLASGSFQVSIGASLWWRDGVYMCSVLLVEMDSFELVWVPVLTFQVQMKKRKMLDL